MDEKYIIPARKERLLPDTPIQGMVHSLLDFWQWAYSDLLNNTDRGLLAEFIVGSALGLIDEPALRVEWDGCDFYYRGGTVEVKSAAYLQSWPQKKLSDIVYNISVKEQYWNVMSYETITCTPPQRLARCYVFALFAEKEPEQALTKLLDTRSWRFYVLPTRVLDGVFGDQEEVSLPVLEKLTAPITYEYLKHAIEDALA